MNEFLTIVRWTVGVSCVAIFILCVWTWIDSWLAWKRLRKMHEDAIERRRIQRNADEDGEYTPKQRARFLP